MTLDEFKDVVNRLELSDESSDVLPQLELVITEAESLLVAAEDSVDRAIVGEIARLLQRAFEATADRSGPAIRTALHVGAGFWSLRAASADVEEVATRDYRGVVMLPTGASPSGEFRAQSLDLASPRKNPLSATVDAPPVPGLPTTPATSPAGGASPEKDEARGVPQPQAEDNQATKNVLAPDSFGSSPADR
jgi:hypothetical protein